MNLNHYRKAIVGAIPSIIGLGLTIAQNRLGFYLEPTEIELLWVIVGIATGGAVYAVPNAPKLPKLPKDG